MFCFPVKLRKPSIKEKELSRLDIASGENDNFRETRWLEVSVGNAWSWSMYSELSTQHQRNNFIPALHAGQSEGKCQSRTLYRFFLYSFPPNLLWSLKRRLRTHDSALRYITVAPLDKRLCEKKNTDYFQGGVTFGTKNKCFCVQFCQIAIPFFVDLPNHIVSSARWT